MNFLTPTRQQMEYFISLMVNADNSIDAAHAERCPLPYQSSMIDDCIGKGKSLQEGGAIYNFTGPQGFGIANASDGLLAVKKLVFDEKKLTLEEYKDALDHNFGKGLSKEWVEYLTLQAAKGLEKEGHQLTKKEIQAIALAVKETPVPAEKQKKYDQLLAWIDEVPKYGNDLPDVDHFAREVAYTYTKPLEKYHNPERRPVPGRAVSGFRKRSAWRPDRCHSRRTSGQHPHCRWCRASGRTGCERPNSHGKLCGKAGSFHCFQRYLVQPEIPSICFKRHGRPAEIYLSDPCVLRSERNAYAV